MTRTATSAAGGSATAGGVRFQARVTAWWAARILLETPIGARFGLGASTVATRVTAESGDDVDDVRIELQGPVETARLYGQCKASLSLSEDATSEWAAVLTQLAHQQTADAATAMGGTPPVACTYRYVVFHEHDNGNLRRLGAVLDRYRGMEAGAPPKDAAKSKAEEEIVGKLLALFDALVTASPTDQGLAHALRDHRETLLRRLFIVQFKLAPGEADFLGVQDALQHGLLADSTQAARAMESVQNLADDLLADRQSRDRDALRDRLIGHGVPLRGAVTYRADFERLAQWSSDELAAHEALGRGRVAVGATTITLDRQAARDVCEAQGAASCLVVGGAGVGKTGCLMAIAQQLAATGVRVWYWAADSLPEISLPALQEHLGLAHPWSALFSEARSANGATLIIDGLDGLREVAAQHVYHKLIGIASRAGVRVIASIRSFDLQYSIDLRQWFPRDWAAGTEATALVGPLGRDVNAVEVADLSESEIAQVLGALPLVRDALAAAPSLREVVRNLFSLDLLCRLLDAGEAPHLMSGISTQAELFDRYWDHRITRSGADIELARELTVVVEQMVRERRLQVVTGAVDAKARRTLLSTGILRTPPAPPGRAADPDRVEFAHHVLFDYVAERLFVRPRRLTLAADLTAGDAWPLMLRPSLVLFFRYLWVRARADFWDTLLTVERANVTGLHRFAAYVVIAEEVRARTDFDPILGGLTDGDAVFWRRVLQGVVVAAPYAALPRQFRNGTGEWWLELAADLLTTRDLQLAYLARRILFAASDHLDTLSPHARRLVNAASIALVRIQRAAEPPSFAIRPAIAWVCRTFAANPVEAATLVRELIEPAELARAGFVQLLEIANHVLDIARHDVALSRDVYAAAFAFTETSTDANPWGGAILRLQGNRKQDYEMARHALAKHFDGFLVLAPREATRGAVAVARSEATHDGVIDLAKLPVDELTINGAARALRDDRSVSWDASEREAYEPSSQLLKAWEDRLVTWANQALLACRDGQGEAGAANIEDRHEVGADGSDDAVDMSTWFDPVLEVVTNENEGAALWRRLLRAAARVPAFYATRLWRFLTEPALLLNRSTIEAAGAALHAFAPALHADQLKEIETAIHGLATRVLAPQYGAAYADKAKSYLLGRIPVELRTMPPLATEIEHAATEEASPSFDDADFVSVHSRTLTTADLLAMHGTKVDTAEHAEMIAAIDALDAVDVDLTDVDELFAQLRTTDDRIGALLGSLDPNVEQAATGSVARRAAALSCSEKPLGEELVAWLVHYFERLLRAGAREPDEEEAGQFDRQQSWSSGDERVSAAQGLICLGAQVETFARCEAGLREIAGDPEPQVRAQLARSIWRFRMHAPQFVWEVLEGWAATVSDPGQAGVLKLALARGWYRELRRRDAPRADALLQDLMRGARDNGDKDLREALGYELGALYLETGATSAADVVSAILAKPEACGLELSGALQVAVFTMWPRSGPRASNLPPAVSERAHALAARVTRALSDALTTYETAWRALPLDQRPAEPAAWVTSTVEVMHRATSEFRLATTRWAREIAPEKTADLRDLSAETGTVPVTAETAGATDGDGGSSGGAPTAQSAPGSPSDSQAAVESRFVTWLETARDVVTELLRAPNASMAFDLVQGIAAIARVDIPRGLRMLREVTDASRSTGLLTEPMAADLTIDILARALADDDGTLAADQAVREDFLGTLEAYLDVGWERAIELALRIESIFRSARSVG